MARITFRSISNNPYSLLYSKYIVTEMRWTPEDDTVRHNEVKIGIVNHFQHSWGHEGFNCSDVAAYVSSLVFQSLQLPFTCPLRMCFRRPFLGKMWPVQLTFLFFFLHFSHGRFDWCPSVSSNTFQSLPDISDLLSEVSKFQHNTKLSSKCSTLLFSFLNLSPLCWW